MHVINIELQRVQTNAQRKKTFVQLTNETQFTKGFKQYITELRGPKPANSNAQHDSDHDMVDVSDISDEPLEEGEWNTVDSIFVLVDFVYHYSQFRQVFLS